MKFKKNIAYELLFPALAFLITLPIPFMPVIMVVYLVAALLKYITYEVEVFDDKLVLRYGIIVRREDKIFFSKIQKVARQQNIVQMPFKIGNIELETGNDKMFMIENIEGHNALLELIESKSQSGS